MWSILLSLLWMAFTPVTSKSKRGRPDEAEWVRRCLVIWHLRRDPIALDECEIARLPAVRAMAQRLYPRHVVPVGKLLGECFTEACREVIHDLDGLQGTERLREFATQIVEGASVVSASRTVGVTPEHGSRFLRVRLAELLARKIQEKLQ